MLVINRVRVLGSGAHTPIHFFGEYPPGGGGGFQCRTVHLVFFMQIQSVNCKL